MDPVQILEAVRSIKAQTLVHTMALARYTDKVKQSRAWLLENFAKTVTRKAYTRPKRWMKEIKYDVIDYAAIRNEIDLDREEYQALRVGCILPRTAAKFAQFEIKMLKRAGEWPPPRRGKGRKK